MSAPVLSIVVPVYGCANCITALHERIAGTLEDVEPNWELILVDDASPDGAWAGLVALAHRDHRVRALRMSRNFGQHAAITAGLAESRGDYVAVMDCDLQDPPEMLPRLLEAAREGFDVVLCRREQRRQSIFRRLAARVFFKLRNALSEVPADIQYSTLSLITRPVVEAFLRMGDRDRLYLLILNWLGFRRTEIVMPHAERHSGRSSYTLSKLIAVALDGMFFQTSRVLRWIVYAGFALAALGMLLAAVFVALYFTQQPLPGFTTLAVLILVVGGFTMLSTGVTGLYVGKIFEQVKGRPLYVLAEEVSGETSPVPPAESVPDAALKR
jgi:dolichol-phosphate mannosyltransferase